MNHSDDYTPLESLFLFQLLLSHGIDNGAFEQISQQLTTNTLIKDDKKYDPARLRPDALRLQFLTLFQNELNGEREGADAPDGTTGSPGSKRRKLDSQPLPTPVEVYENVDKIPSLLGKLYTRYQERIIKEIREDERQYIKLQTEIRNLERVERERRARAASQNGTPALAPREAKPAITPNGPAATPSTGTPVAARKPPTPVLPPKHPPIQSASPTVAPPSHLAATSLARPSPPPKPPNGTGSVLQAPAGLPQTGPRPLQPPLQAPKQTISPRPEVGIKPKDAPSTPQPATPVASALKWEKPYQPPNAQTPPPRSFQSPIQAPVPQAHATPSGPQQVPLPQQPQPQQKQWYPQVTPQQAQPLQQPQAARQTHPHPHPHPPHPQAQAAQPAQHQQSPRPQQSPHPQPPKPPVQQQVQHPPQSRPQPQRPQQVQPRPTPGKPGLVPPQTSGQLAPPLQPAPPRPAGETPSIQAPHVRPPSTTPVPPPPIRPIQPPQAQAQAQQAHRPIASAAPTPPAGTTGPVAPPQQRWPQAFQQQQQKQQQQKQQQQKQQPQKQQPQKQQPQKQQQQQQQQQQQAQTPAPATSPAPVPQKDKLYASPYVAQHPKPAIPQHVARQVANTPTKRLGTPSTPQTPISAPPLHLTHGFGTRWASQSTPSTPKPLSTEPESPAFEPVSPPQQPATLPSSAASTPRPPKKQTPKPTSKPTVQAEVSANKPLRGRVARSSQKARGVSATPSLPRTRRSQSVMSHTEEPVVESSEPAPKIKHEVATPRAPDEPGDTTADESVPGRPQIVTPSSVSSRLHKRKRQDTPLDSPVSTMQVLWTRGFTKVSSSALDQISSHRDANMFATALREKDAPNYRQIVLQPQDITSIRSAIKHGNKAAVHAAANLPGGDPGTAHVWLPMSDELVPPKGIINSAQLERELVHMFCNAIMYNPDPDRGPGPGFMKRSQDEEEEVVGYRLDENGVVKNTRSMFVEVEKLLGDLRSAEKERSAPPPSATRPASVATPAEDTAEDDDEGTGDRETGAGTAKRRRVGRG